MTLDSDRFHDIFRGFTLHIGDAGYRNLVKEASFTLQINPQFVVPTGSSSMVDKGSNKDIRKAVIHGEDVALVNEMGTNHWPNGNKVATASSERAISGNSKSEFEVGDSQIGDKIGSCSPVSINSSPSFKTRTAHLSQNGYSEEIFKLSQKVPDSQIVEGKGQVSEGPDKHIIDPGCNEHPRIQSQDSEPSIPPGFDPQVLNACGENSFPSGFEAVIAAESSPVQKQQAIKRHHDLSVKRLTRSQAKLNKKSEVRTHHTLNRGFSGRGRKESTPQTSLS